MVPKFTGTKCSVFRAQPGRVSAPPINFGSVVIGGFSPRYFPPGTHHGPRSCNYVVRFALSMVAFPRKRTWLNCVRDARTPDQGGQTRNEHPYVYGFRQLGFVNRVCCARFVAG